MIDRSTCEVRRDEFGTFDSRTSCLRWIMEYRLQLNKSLPGANIRAVQLDRWLLGLD